MWVECQVIFDSLRWTNVQSSSLNLSLAYPLGQFLPHETLELDASEKDFLHPPTQLILTEVPSPCFPPLLSVFPFPSNLHDMWLRHFPSHQVLLFIQRILKLRATKVFLLSLFLWLVSFEYCRVLFWRDPHSAFFDDRHVYDLKYSLYREREAQHFISQHNSLLEPPEFFKSDPNPFVCASIVTIGRPSDNYFDPSIGSLLEGLNYRERRALFLNVLFADTNPEKHPSWGQKWVPRLTDTATSYNVSNDQFRQLQKWEEDRNYYAKGVLYVHRINNPL